MSTSPRRSRLLLAALLLAISLPSCFTMTALDGDLDNLDHPPAVLPLALVLDAVTMPIQLAVLAELSEDAEHDDDCEYHWHWH